MKSQALLTVWCNISGGAGGEIWHWSLSGVKGLTTRSWPFEVRAQATRMCQKCWHGNQTVWLTADWLVLGIHDVTCVICLSPIFSQSHNLGNWVRSRLFGGNLPLAVKSGLCNSWFLRVSLGWPSDLTGRSARHTVGFGTAHVVRAVSFTLLPRKSAPAISFPSTDCFSSVLLTIRASVAGHLKDENKSRSKAVSPWLSYLESKVSNLT